MLLFHNFQLYSPDTPVDSWAVVQYSWRDKSTTARHWWLDIPSWDHRVKESRDWLAQARLLVEVEQGELDIENIILLEYNTKL